VEDLENFVRSSAFFGGESSTRAPGANSTSNAPNGNRVPPHSIEAERSFLGGLLIDNQALNRVIDVSIDPEDFYREGHQKIFRSITELMAKGDPADLITVTNALQTQGALEKIGGAKYLSTLVEEEFSSANVSKYAEIIKQKAIQRKLIQTCNEVSGEVFNGIEEQEEFLDSVEKRIFSITEMKHSHSFEALKDVLLKNFQEIQDLANQKVGMTGVSTGFADLDKHTSGWRPGQLIIIAARPGMGKTSFMLNLAKHAALESKKPVAIFSMEMTRLELGMRLLSTDAKVDSERLKTGRLQEQDWRNISRSGARLAAAPIFLDETGGLNLLELKSRCRRLQSIQQGLGLVIVDYLQLMSGLTKKGMSSNREQEIAEISRGLKSLAKELGVPVIAASQLNRGVETRQDKRPMLSDLRESGAIEQDADIVIFIHREDHYNKERTEERGIAEIIIGKHRAGQTGIVKLAWLGQYTSFEDLSPRDMPQGGGF
jgi:replicative DNA helicase